MILFPETPAVPISPSLCQTRASTKHISGATWVTPNDLLVLPPILAVLQTYQDARDRIGPTKFEDTLDMPFAPSRSSPTTVDIGCAASSSAVTMLSSYRTSRCS